MNLRPMLWLIGSFAVGGSAFGANYNMAGCGLGSLIIKDDGVIQIVAATFNGTSGNQTFGISSGTSNCLPAEKHARLQQQEEFFVANFSAISKESAQGRGETLNALATQLGCGQGDYAPFKNLMKTNYDEIFSAPGAITALDRTKHLVRKESGLGASCHDLI